MSDRTWANDPKKIRTPSVSGVTLNGLDGTRVIEWCKCVTSFDICDSGQIELPADVREFLSPSAGLRCVLTNPKFGICEIFMYDELPRWAIEILNAEHPRQMGRIPFDSNGLNLLQKRYLRKKPKTFHCTDILDKHEEFESPEVLFYRIAGACAGVYRLRLYEKLFYVGDENVAAGCKCFCTNLSEISPKEYFNLAQNVCEIETRVFKYTSDFFREMASLRMIPAGRVLRSVGTGLPVVGNCAVIDLLPDAVSNQIIFAGAADLQRRGAGVGYPFHLIDPGLPNSSYIGPVGALKMASEMLAIVTEDGRRAANMGIMSVEHPDILEFIEVKTRNETEITNFNLSVSLSDKFMQTLLTNPTQKWEGEVNGQKYTKLHLIERSSAPRSEGGGKIITSIKEVEMTVGEVFDRIAECARVFGEPGVVFLDTFNRYEMSGFPVNATNPCGEEGMPSGGDCILASINHSAFVSKEWEDTKNEIITSGLKIDAPFNYKIAEHGKLVDVATSAPTLCPSEEDRNLVYSYSPNGSTDFPWPIRANCPLDYILSSDTDQRDLIDLEKVRKTAATTVELLDAIVSITDYPSTFPHPERRSGLRRIGVGSMGIADLLAKVRLPYASQKGRTLVSEMHEVVKYSTELTSRKLAEEYGSFPLIETSRWNGHTMRNVGLRTCPPTGSISMLAGCSSGCEPFFSIAYTQKGILDGQTSLTFFNRIFQDSVNEILYRTFYSIPHLKRLWGNSGCANSKTNSSDVFRLRLKTLELVGEIQKKVAAYGNLGFIETLPDHDPIKKFFPKDFLEIFATSMQITPLDHLKMVATLQKHIDNAISKTINLPERATGSDIKTIVIKAWESGCKGLTVYVDGSRDRQILNIGHTLSDSSSEITDQVVANQSETTKKKDPIFLNEVSDVEEDDPHIAFSHSGDGGDNSYGNVTPLESVHHTPIGSVLECTIDGCQGPMIQKSLSCVVCLSCSTEVCGTRRFVVATPEKSF